MPRPFFMGKETDMPKSKAELIAYAEEHGIEGVSASMTKAEIIAVLRGE